MVNVATAWQTALATTRSSTGSSLATAQAWRQATVFIDPTRLLQEPTPSLTLSSDITGIFHQLDEAKLPNDLFEWYLNALRRSFPLAQSSILPYLDEYERHAVQSPEQCPVIVSAMLNEIGLLLEKWQRPIDLFWPHHSRVSIFRNTFMVSLYASLPPGFSKALTTYLRALMTLPTPSTLKSDHRLALTILTLLLERYDPLLFALVYEEIERKVVEECKGDFGEPKLAGVLKWLSEDVVGWLGGLYAKEEKGAEGLEEAKKMLKPTFSRFEYHVHKTLALLRSTELFDIIVNDPDSKPALEDLRLCLQKTDQRSIIVSRLRALHARRLLHPGADTKDIISHYIACIRCLRLLDPQGVLLSRVAEPIRHYLRTREDTIRCIVSSLIEDGHELVAELAASDARLVHDSRDEAENYNDPKWTPDPIDAPPDYRKSKSSDVIQLLVSIYNTKDVFIKELQVLLAQRLLAIKDYGLDREIRNVEILKIRFGESSLAGPEVMIKDLQDSRRIDQAVHEHAKTPLHATIVSRLFWPELQHQPLKLPGQFAKAQSAYDKSFTGHRPEKRLRWLPQLGTTNITVELRDRTLTLDATALQASIIELFSMQDTWEVDDLQIELRADSASIKNALYFWNNLGVVKSINAESEEWQLLEVADKATEAAPAHVIEEAEAAVQTVESQATEEMRVFWQFVQGMLKNLGALPISRMHSMLNMTVPAYKGKTQNDLLSFLEAMAAEGWVEKSGANWKIVK